MFVTSISVRREGYYGPYGGGVAKEDAPFQATVELHGQLGKVELKLDPEMSKRIVAVIADEVAAAGRATAEAMTADFISGQPLLAAE